jgi:hypothetical protein
MLNANGSILADNRSPASQWAAAALGLPEVQVQARLRGNHLHILCEAPACPSQELVTARFKGAIEQTDLTRLLPDGAKIYQLFLCGRKLGSRQNDWTVRLDCSGKQRQPQPQPPEPEPQLKVSEVPPPASPPENPPPASPKGGGFFRKFKNENRNFKLKSESVETPAQPPQVREEMDFDSQSFPLKNRIEYPEVFETSPVTIDTAGGRETFSPPAAGPAPQRGAQQQVSRGAVALIQSPETDSDEGDGGGTLTVSPETLARRGYPDAIASYLSEILGPMGVSVKVSIREKEVKNSGETSDANAPPTLKSKERRLLVLCESAYSPDPSLLAEPIASRLRKLQLEDVVEAAIGSQVRGEAKPDWVLRVDLTPPDTILKEWARWGDVAAIAKLLNQHLAASKIEVRATLKEATLHLFCSKTAKKGQKPKRQEYPDKQQTTEAIAPLLASFAPQGIRAATIYGVEPTSDSKTEPESPVWIDWVDLPAAHHPDLAASPRILAAEGDQLALTFLLNRLLNPNLGRKLETGGIRAVALHKNEVLHVMTEALTCPAQSKVGPSVAKFLRQLQIPGVTGVRVYGRRAGQKLPLWRYGIDLRTAVDGASTPIPAPAPSQQTVLSKEPVPEFAPSVTDGSFSGLGENLVFDAPAPNSWRPGFKIRLPGHKLGEQLVQAAVQPLVASGLFVPNEGLSTNAAAPGGVRADRAAGMALIWAIAGCLLVFNTDWLLGLFLQSAAVSQAPSLSEVCTDQKCQNPSSTPLPDVQSSVATPASPQPDASSEELNLPQIPLEPNPSALREAAFNGSGFTKPGNTSVPVADVSAAGAFPTLRSEQLDEQIARYQAYIRQHKQPPDILIVGSSRALRGIDPEVLEKALAAGGYPGLKAYNFGVNGATLQVVDSIVRRILPPQQLPKLLVLADGARALNSGRPDLTFSAIASSEGYRQLARGSFLIRTNQLESPTSKETANNPVATASELVHNLAENQAQVQQLLNQKLVDSSAIYKKRSRLKGFLRSLANPSAPVATEGAQTAGSDKQTTEDAQPTGAGKAPSDFQPNGFLPIDIRFSPDTYFQKHAKVSGYYDSDYQDFKLIGEQTVALKNLIEFTKVRNINLVFVNMPLTEDYLDPVRTGYEQEFRQYMQQLAAQTKLIFRDNSLLWPQARESFSDPSHLNRYGAVAVSKRLAQDPMIPWPVKK